MVAGTDYRSRPDRRRQVKTIKDDEIADRSDEDSPFTYHDDIDLAEMSGFSVRRT